MVGFDRIALMLVKYSIAVSRSEEEIVTTLIDVVARNKKSTSTARKCCCHQNFSPNQLAERNSFPTACRCKSL